MVASGNGRPSVQLRRIPGQATLHYMSSQAIRIEADTLRALRERSAQSGEPIVRLAQRYIDDEAFARYWVEQRAKFRPKGQRAIVSELIAKGVARETIDVVLGDADPDAETKRAREAIRRPMTRWLSMADNERKRTIHQYLAARGFSYDVIEEVIAKPEADQE